MHKDADNNSEVACIPSDLGDFEPPSAPTAAAVRRDHSSADYFDPADPLKGLSKEYRTMLTTPASAHSQPLAF